MAIITHEQITTLTRSDDGHTVAFTVNSTQGSGSYLLFTLDQWSKGFTVSLSGTDGAAVCTLGYLNPVDGTVETYQLSTIAAGQDLEIPRAGAGRTVYLIVTGADGSTDLDVVASKI